MFEIRTAQRHGARLLIQLSGVSGSGKTRTALELAFGLAGGDASKIIGIDSENRRMSLNADCLPGGARFRVLEFFAPFSPERYIAAIEAACKAGAEVIVIDSVSHEWESEGGCEWIANQTRFPDWKRAKHEHKRFMTYMLQCPAHVIACTRAREKVDFTDPKNPRSLGIQPIQEKNFSFEATVSLLMHDQGRRQDVLKCPGELQAILGRGDGYLSAEDGAAVRAWVDGATPIDPKVEHARGMLQNVAEAGVEALRRAWEATPRTMQRKLGAKFLESVKASAAAFDAGRAAAGAPADDDTTGAVGTLNAFAASAAPVTLAPRPGAGMPAESRRAAESTAAGHNPPAPAPSTDPADTGVF